MTVLTMTVPYTSKIAIVRIPFYELGATIPSSFVFADSGLYPSTATFRMLFSLL